MEGRFLKGKMFKSPEKLEILFIPAVTSHVKKIDGRPMEALFHAPFE